jgi:hypothetical protein
MSDAHPCVDKKVYVFKHKAQAAAERQAKRYRKSMRVYTCPRCGFYHLTSKELYEPAVHGVA